MKRRLLIIALAILVILPVGPTLHNLTGDGALEPVVVEALAAGSENSGSPGNIHENDTQTFTVKVKDAARAMLAKLGIDEEFAKYYATWIVGAPTLVILILLAMIFRPRRKRITPAQVQRSEGFVAKKASRPHAYKARLEPGHLLFQDLVLRHLGFR